jgi:hypothetical protein
MWPGIAGKKGKVKEKLVVEPSPVAAVGKD